MRRSSRGERIGKAMRVAMAAACLGASTFDHARAEESTIAIVAGSTKVNASEETQVTHIQLVPATRGDRRAPKVTASNNVALLVQSSPGGEQIPSPLANEPLDRAEQAWVNEDRKPIGNVGLDIAPDKGDMPANVAAAAEQNLPSTFEGQRRHTRPLRYMYGWPASNICHNPLYFEEPGVERYGRTAGPLLQPVVSGLHFYGNVAAFPWKMAVHPPRSLLCKGSTQYCSPSPFLRKHPLLRLGAGSAQSAVVTTGLLVP
jgi:hypothetical protein